MASKRVQAFWRCALFEFDIDASPATSIAWRAGGSRVAMKILQRTFR